MHILLVDDDQLALLVHKQIIEKLFVGAKITSYNNPVKLIEDITNKSIDFPNVIFSDYHMGAINGVDVLEAIESLFLKNKTANEKLDFFLVSSESDLKSITKNLKHEIFNACITKPLTEKKVNKLLYSKIAS